MIINERRADACAFMVPYRDFCRCKRSSPHHGGEGGDGGRDYGQSGGGGGGSVIINGIVLALGLLEGLLELFFVVVRAGRRTAKCRHNFIQGFIAPPPAAHSKATVPLDCRDQQRTILWRENRAVGAKPSGALPPLNVHP